MNEFSAESGAQTLMYAEARGAAQAVARLLQLNSSALACVRRHLHAAGPASVLTVARGSSDNACTYGRYLIENATGVTCTSSGLSIASIYDAPTPGPGLCIAVSQSGASPDLLAAVNRVRRSGSFTVGLINQPKSPLASLCDAVVDLQAAPERSVAATGSYIASLAALACIVAEWTDDEGLLQGILKLPAMLDAAWDLDWTGLETNLIDASNMFVLGRGPGLGVAQEAALKFKETCGIHAEAFSAAEVIHGPMALVREGFPVLVLSQDDESGANSVEITERLVGMGAKVMFAGGKAKGAINLPTLPAHPALQPILIAQSFYRAAANLSVDRGFDPDCPPHLAKVTRTR